jgi:hypothetical protein
MKLQMKIALAAAGVLALTAGSTALATGKPEGVPPHGNSANGKGPAYTPAEPTPGPKAGLPAKAKAYGRYLQRQEQGARQRRERHRVLALRERDGQSGDEREDAARTRLQGRKRQTRQRRERDGVQSLRQSGLPSFAKSRSRPRRAASSPR